MTRGTRRYGRSGTVRWTDRVREAYGDPTYRRLAVLKNRWDPANMFRVNQNIAPQPLGAAG
jgi:hypothetical protein